MKPFEGIYTYFDSGMGQYDRPFSQCKNQVELDNLVIKDLEQIRSGYVTKLAFDSVETIVHVCLEDWPAAIGSVFSVIGDLWKVIGLNSNGGLQGPQTADILERLNAIEQFLASQGYVPPQPQSSP